MAAHRKRPAEDAGERIGQGRREAGEVGDDCHAQALERCRPDHQGDADEAQDDPVQPAGRHALVPGQDMCEHTANSGVVAFKIAASPLASAV